MNIGRDPDKKAPNPNLAEFKRLYGNKATHLNALMITKHKKNFKKILDNPIQPHWDNSIYQDMIDEYESEPEQIDNLDEAKERMRNRVDRYLH